MTWIVGFTRRRARRQGHPFRVARTVECTDCHNPHAVVGGLGAALLRAAGSGPLLPPAMKDVPAISLSGLPVDKARFYYEVCFRCHADRPVIVTDRIPQQQDPGGNVRRQFLPTAASAHPVAFPSRRTAAVPSLLPVWRTRRFISCQDCHNNPGAISAGGTLPDGPHSSRFDHLLVARYETRDFTIESPQACALRYQCHDRNSILGDESFRLHRNHVLRGRAPCSASHTAHGVSGSSSQHGHLINFDIAIVGGQRSYVDTGRFSGSCTLICHGVGSHAFERVYLGSPFHLFGAYEIELDPLPVGVVTSLAGAIVLFVLIYRMWASIQDGYARTSPGQAVGFLLIPFFNLYWLFQVFWGYAVDFNAYLVRHRLEAARLRSGRFLTYSIASIVALIPLVGPFVFVANRVLLLFLASAVCDRLPTGVWRDSLQR